MIKIAEGVYFIQGMDEMIPDSHVYVIGKKSSKDFTLIDAGLMGKENYKIQEIKKIGIEIEDIKRIIMTHTHLDHIGCLPEIMKQIPAAEIWIHETEAEMIEKGDDRSVYGMDMFKSLFQMQHSLKDDHFTFQVDKKLSGGETFEIGGMTWEIIHIPGHSAGSIALYHREKKILIPGDTVYADNSIGRFDLYGANASALNDSLKKLSELEVKILLPGHNHIVEDVSPDYISKTTGYWAPQLV